MKTSVVITTSVVISSLVSIGGSFVVTTNIVRQEIEQNLNIVDQQTEQRINLVKQELTQLVRQEITQIGGQQAAGGGIVLQGGSTIETMSGVIAK